MHVVPAPKGLFRVVRKDGHSVVCDGLLEALGHLPRRWRDPDLRHVRIGRFGFAWDRDGERVDAFEYAVVGPDGEDVPRDEVLRARKAAAGGRRTFRYVRRHGPVPGVHKTGGYRWHRSIRTHQEIAFLKAGDDDVEDAGMHSAHGRRAREIRTSWDDVDRCVTRSWKAHRRDQWHRLGPG